MIRQTSIDAYTNLVDNGKLSMKRRAVYKVLYNHGPMTQKKMRKDYFNGDLENSVGPRFKELEDRGLIRDVGTRECERTGITNMLWDVTDLVEPKDLPKKESRETKKENVLAMLRDLYISMEDKQFRNEVKLIGIYIKEEL
jgi:hypothetical protein